MVVTFNGALLAKNELRVVQDQLLSALEYGKMQSLLSNKVLTLSPNESSTWSTSVLLYDDKNTNHKFDGGDELYHSWTFNGRVTIEWRGFHSSNYLMFAKDILRSSSSGRFRLNDTSGQSKPIDIIVNRLGRARLSQH